MRTDIRREHISGAEPFGIKRDQSRTRPQVPYVVAFFNPLRRTSQNNSVSVLPLYTFGRTSYAKPAKFLVKGVRESISLSAFDCSLRLSLLIARMIITKKQHEMIC